MSCNILCVVELEEKRFIERAKVAINTSLVNAKEEYQRGDVVVEERNEDDYVEGEDEGLENNGEEQKEEGVVEEDKKDEGVGTGEVNGEEGGDGEAEVQAEEGEGEGKQFVEAEMQVEGGNDEEQQQQEEEEQQQQEDADVNENVYEEDKKEIINEDENGTKVEIHEEKRVENQDGTTTVQVTKITKTVEIQETKQIIAEGDDNVEGNDEIIEGEHQAISVDNENAHNSQQPSSSPVAEGGSGGIIQL